MLKKRFLLLLFLLVICQLFYSCKWYAQKPSSTFSFNNTIDSLKAISKTNSLNEFNMAHIQTDNFEDMTLITNSLYNKIYSNNDFRDSSFFIHSYLPSPEKMLYAVTYEKNFESENYRVDHLDLLCLNVNGELINKLRLATIDNEVITHEVTSNLSSDTLRIVELISSEPYFNPDRDTLYKNEALILLNRETAFDTIKLLTSYRIRPY